MTGEHLAPDIQLFLRLLHAHGVRYLLVGGEAVIHHGYARLTGDIDLYFEQTTANARKLYAALEEFWGGAVPAVESEEALLEPDIVVQFGRPPNRIDLLSSLGTVPFAAAWRRRVKEQLHLRRKKIPLPVLSLDDLVQSKRDAGRHKDLDDIEHLEAIRKKTRRRR